MKHPAHFSINICTPKRINTKTTTTLVLLHLWQYKLMSNMDTALSISRHESLLSRF